jgi:hypothetical protein
MPLSPRPAPLRAGFHKRRLERQSVASSEIKLKERRERIKLRREYKKEITRMVDQRGLQLANAGLTSHADLVAQSTEEKEFDSKEQLVTVTTVAYGFGEDSVAADPVDPMHASATSNELLHRAQRAHGSLAALKKTAFKTASAAQPVRQQKPKRSRKQHGAVPKTAKGKGGKKMKQQGKGKKGGRE